jgi:hypothetical protein
VGAVLLTYELVLQRLDMVQADVLTHTAIQASGLSRTACYSLSRLSQHINSHITLQWLDTAKVYMQARPWLQPLCVLHNDTAAVDAKPRLTYELILQRLDMIQADVQVWPQ